MSEGLIISRLISAIGLALVAGLALRTILVRPHRQSTFTTSLGMLVVAGLGGQIAITAYAISPDQGFLAWQPIVLLTTATWSGTVLSVRLCLAIALLLVCVSIWRWKPAALMLLAASSLFLMPFSGHAVSGEPWQASLAIHGVHALSVTVWAGSVLVLAIHTWQSVEPAEDHAAIAAFSPIALGLILSGTLSGIAAAWLQAGSIAALLGTTYGHILLVKCVILFGIALACAAWLRWHYLPQAGKASPRLALLLEAGMGCAMLVAAAILSQSVPGRHADIAWPLPFRLDWRLLAAAPDANSGLRAYLIFAASALGLSFAALLFRAFAPAALVGLAGLLIGALGLSGLAVPAYPTTYASSISDYGVARLANAERIFLDTCADCHGRTGHGHGVRQQIAGAPAADLTAPHTGDHSAGDMYWWITNGKPGTAMPGFEDETTEQDRWDLVNYVRLLGYSAQSVDVDFDIFPQWPFLPSIDVPIETPDGANATLRELEGVQPVLLVLARDERSLDRLAELDAARQAIEDTNLLVLFICRPGLCDALQAVDRGKNILVLRSGAADILNIWSYYRRTASNMDLDDRAKDSGHQEYLIDRFGYVRAKWWTRDSLFSPIEAILRDVRLLANEPRILASPADHAH